MNCDEIHPLLAGYVDDELSAVERQAVEEHVAACQACRTLLEEQRQAVAVYAAYPVEEAAEEDWQRVWADVSGRLPARSKRVSLEYLTDMAASDEFAEEEPAPPQPEAEPPAVPARPRPETPRTEEPTEERPEPVRLPRPEPRRAPIFKPLHIPRVKHTFWAHVAGVAAAALIVAMVLLSIKPVIRIEQLATTGQVVTRYQVRGSPDDPAIIMLEADNGATIPLIWVARGPDVDANVEEGEIR